jgi:hypothetical protein
LYFYRTRIVCHWIIYGYAPMIRLFVYRSFVLYIVHLRFPYSSFVSFRSCILHSFRVSSIRFVYRAFFVGFVCVFRSFAFGAYCKLIRSRICSCKSDYQMITTTAAPVNVRLALELINIQNYRLTISLLKKTEFEWLIFDWHI